MARRDDRQRRHERRQRNRHHREALLVKADGNVIRVQRRVVLHDRGGLVVEFDFGHEMAVGVLGVRFVEANAVTIRRT